MKRLFSLFILGLTLLTFISCGGGGSDSSVNIVLDGTWVGSVAFANTNPPIGTSIAEVTEHTYTLELSTRVREGSELVDFFIIDSFGNTYSGTYYQELAIAHNDAEEYESDGLMVRGPSNITFENINGDKAQVRFIYFFGYRGVVDTYEGEFTRLQDNIYLMRLG